MHHATMYHYANVHIISMSISNLAGLQVINQYMQNVHHVNRISQINMEPTCRAMTTSSHARCSRIPFPFAQNSKCARYIYITFTYIHHVCICQPHAFKLSFPQYLYFQHHLSISGILPSSNNYNISDFITFTTFKM